MKSIQNPEKMTPATPKIVEDSIKTVMLTPSSSVKSTTTIESNLSETRDSFYFPGCRKDANCNCEMCIASMNATRDLMPQSTHGRPFSKLSTSRRPIPRSPVAFGSSGDLSTPKLRPKVRSVTMSPPLDSTARMNFQEEVKRRKRGLDYGVLVMKLLVGLFLVCGMEFGVPFMVSRVLEAKFSPDLLRDLGVKAREFEVLNRRFLFLKNKLEGFVGKRVSNCSSPDSVWKINQDGLLLNSRCVLYESMAEEVSIWGWPLQTAGLLTADYSTRSFTVISGRVTEWSNEDAKYLEWRADNSSWAQVRWSSSVVQFDPNTWILEYKQSFLLENPRLLSFAAELLKFRLRREFEKMKQELWLPIVFGSRHSDLAGGSSAIPT